MDRSHTYFFFSSFFLKGKKKNQEEKQSNSYHNVIVAGEPGPPRARASWEWEMHSTHHSQGKLPKVPSWSHAQSFLKLQGYFQHIPVVQNPISTSHLQSPPTFSVALLKWTQLSKFYQHLFALAGPPSSFLGHPALHTMLAEVAQSLTAQFLPALCLPTLAPTPSPGGTPAEGFLSSRPQTPSPGRQC